MKDHLSSKQNKHLAAYEPQEILKHCGQRRRLFVIKGVEYNVRMNSARYYTFIKSLACVCCGLEGTVMMLDMQTKQKHGKPHFNLYTEWEGELVLMTKDHILPKAQGGINHLSNYQTMCTLCNGIKKDMILSIEEMRKIPEIADRINRIKIIKETGKDPKLNIKTNDPNCYDINHDYPRFMGWYLD
jgi:hypothetical protein